MKRPVIYNYLDYRAFLNDLYLYWKKRKKRFSYRFFSEKAGFTSPNFLKLVTSGQRNLTDKSRKKIANGFELKTQEKEFFKNLVLMNQSTSHEGKNHYYKKMMSMRGYLNIHRIDKSKYTYFSKWYYPVIREIVSIGNRAYTPSQIAKLLIPEIKAKQAEKALKVLTELGLIKEKSRNRWIQQSNVVSTGPEVKSLIVTNFHQEMLKRSAEAIELHSAEERDISALTIRIKKNKIAEIKKRIELFRKEILALASHDEGSDQVVQINIQAFPFSKQIEEETEEKKLS